MKRFYVQLGVVLGLVLGGCNFTVNTESEPQAYDAVIESDFDWLLGDWQGQTENGLIEEKWEKKFDHVFLGKSSLIKGDSVVPLEEIRLARNPDGNWVLTVHSLVHPAEDEVHFTLAHKAADGFRAENLEHDYPKRIHYARINNDSVNAWIDNGSDSLRMNFYYGRKK